MGSAPRVSWAAGGRSLAIPREGQAERRFGERRGKPRFVLRERRCGYDRRDELCDGAFLIPQAVDAKLRTIPGLLPALLAAANLLSLADIFLTTRLLKAGAAEANPLLRALMDLDVRLAAGVKISLVAAATLLIWRYRSHRKILPLALIAAAAFAAVVAYEVALLSAA